MILLVLFDDCLQARRFRFHGGVQLRQVQTRARCGLSQVVAFMPVLDACPDEPGDLVREFDPPALLLGGLFCQMCHFAYQSISIFHCSEVV